MLIKRALDQAAAWHDGGWRKYPGVQIPYMSHVAGVVLILGRHGFDEEVLAAGVLHDAVEDTEATLQDIERLFGRRVATLVDQCSEPDKTKPWEERKAAYLARFVAGRWEGQAISLADKIDNLQSIVVCREDHGDPWAMLKRGREAQLRRYEALLTAARTLAPHPLIREYEAALRSVADP